MLAFVVLLSLVASALAAPGILTPLVHTSHHQVLSKVEQAPFHHEQVAARHAGAFHHNLQNAVNVHHQASIHHQPAVHQPTFGGRNSVVAHNLLQKTHVADVHQTHQTSQLHHHEAVASRHQQEPVLAGSLATARITQQDMEVNPDGSFVNVWNSDNGIQVQEQGTVKRVGNEDVSVQNGEISYVDLEGNHFHLKYVADENGFRVEGAHLPTPPPIPAGIARGLEFIAAHPDYESTSTYKPFQNLPVVVDN